MDGEGFGAPDHLSANAIAGHGRSNDVRSAVDRPSRTFRTLMYACAAAFGLLGVGELVLTGGALVGAVPPGESLFGLVGSVAFMALGLGCVAMSRAKVRVADD